MDNEAPDTEIDPVTGKLRTVELHHNSIVQTTLNRKLLYTKSEVDALIAGVSSGGANLWTNKTSTYTFVTPTPVTQNLLIGDITAGLAPIVAVGQPKAIFADDSGTGTNFFINHSAGTGFSFGGIFVSARSRGTADVPTVVQAGDYLGGLASFAFDGTGYAAHGVSHLLPGVFSVATGTPALAAVDRKIYFGSLSASMVSFNTFDNAVKLNESNLIATTTIGSSAGTALTINGTTGVATLAFPGTVAGSAATIDGTQIFTGKTYDTAGTGNSFKINGLAATANTGTGAVVRATSPALTTPTGIVKADVGLGNVDNTSNATERAATRTLTNARVTKRVVTVTQSATPTINTDNTDVASITGLAQAITSMTTNLTGTPVDGDTLTIRITDNATARAITWGASFEASTVALPTTTVISAMLMVGFIWNTVTSKWRCVAVA